MAKKMSAREVAALATVVVTAVETGKKVIDAVDPDGRSTSAAAGLGRKVVETARIKGPLDRIGDQLALVEDAAANLAARGDDDDVETAARWSRDAQALQAKVPLVRGSDRKARKAATQDLQARAAALLKEAVQHGLEDAPAPQAPSRRKVLGRG